MKVYFSHGKESGPWGSKICHLASIAKEYGCAVESLDYSDLMNPDLRVTRLLDTIKNEKEDFLLVGSSMGGYVSLVAAEQTSVLSVFLMAPALYLPGYEKQEYHTGAKHLEIVHGWSDETIPPEHSIRFARQADCTLHLISGDHRLTNSIKTVGLLFRQFLTGSDIVHRTV
jgi:pimeloyl-ACP methyl ester carboxylesterase